MRGQNDIISPVALPQKEEILDQVKSSMQISETKKDGV